MATDLKILTNADRAFYPLMGPFLANRDVVKAVGGPIWDDEAKTWLVLVRDRRVLGFVAVAARGHRTTVESLYARPGLNRVAAELVGAAVDRFGRHKLFATVACDRMDAFTAAGFVETERTVNFARLVREADR